MIILPVIVFVYLLSICFSFSKSRIRAFIDACILCAACSVIIAEITSIFHAYALLPVSALWVLILAITIYFHRSKYGSCIPCRHFLHGLPRFSKAEVALLFLMAGTFLVVLIRLLIAPPCSPADSLAYHLPRAFMYYKNQSIHSFPASYGHMLYFGPLNAILMSMSQILCFGWDGLFGFVQYMAYAICILSVFQITRLLCGSRTCALIAAAMACFMPIAHLQASTTQSDLLVSAFCAAALYLMVQTFFDFRQARTVSVGRYVVLGLCCGLAVLSKLNAGIVLVCFAVLFAVLLFMRQKRKAFRSICIILLCAILMTCGFWVRNALAFDGDFLPLSYAGSRPDYQALGVKGVALIVAKALAITFAAPSQKLPAIFSMPSYTFANTFAKLLHMDLNDPLTNEVFATFTGVLSSAWPDNASFPVQSVLVLLALLFCIVYSICKRKWWLFGYASCCLFAILLTATQYQWVDSFNRYLMPGFLLSLPLCAYMLQKLLRKQKVFVLVSSFCWSACLPSTLLCPDRI